MNQTAHLHSLITQIAAEHRTLVRHLHELRRLVSETETGPAIAQSFATATAALKRLREEMRSHFAEEAAGGVIDEAVARLPRLAAEANAIEREHPEMLLLVDQTIQLTEQGVPTAEEWKRVRDSVEVLVSKMLAHEAAENRLLKLGFNEDF